MMHSAVAESHRLKQNGKENGMFRTTLSVLQESAALRSE